MKKMKRNLNKYKITGYILLSFSFFLLIPLSGCFFLSTGNITITPDQPERIKPQEKDIKDLEDEATIIIQGDLPQEIILKGQLTLSALKDYNYELIEELIHPDMCLRFSPYPYMADTNLSFCPEELDDVVNSDNVLNWGNYDGTGEPIRLKFIDYHDKFIYDSDFSSAPIIGLNVEVSSGNSINNIPDIFPDGLMIEYYFPGFDAQYGGMDWKSLRLVFINVDEVWYLAAIIHGEWTI